MMIFTKYTFYRLQLDIEIKKLHSQTTLCSKLSANGHCVRKLRFGRHPKLDLAGFSLLLVSKVMKNPPNEWNLPSFETKSNEKPAKSNFGCLPKRSFLTPRPFALHFEQNVICECSFFISMSS